MSPQAAMALVGDLAGGVMPESADGSARPNLDVEMADTLLLGLGLVQRKQRRSRACHSIPRSA